jgi:ankyrin repeat protein
MLKNGAKLAITDSDGRDLLIHAVITNNTLLVEFLLQNGPTGGLNKDVTDLVGKTAVHYVVNPVPLGSYENKKILNLLAKAGYKLEGLDNSKLAPIDYAKNQRSRVLLNELLKLTNKSPSTPSKIASRLSGISIENWPKSSVDFETDHSKFLKEA